VAADAHKIVVAGDVSIDWLQLAVAAEPMPEDGQPVVPNWRLYEGTRMVVQPGGAMLLTRMVESATDADVTSYRLDDLENTPPQHTVHSIVRLARYPYGTGESEGDRKKVYRVECMCGFAGPTDTSPVMEPVPNDDPDADMVILDDSGNGFRDANPVWPKAVLAEDKDPIILYKMSRPIAQGALWQAVRQRHADRLVVVVSGNDLRAEGVNISRRLSWERTAKDFVWQLACNPKLGELANCRRLVVRLGIDAAIYVHRNGKSVTSTLYYDPMVAEDGFTETCPGDMLGFSCSFVAALAAKLTTRRGLAAIGTGVCHGILSSRQLCRLGFGDDESNLDYPCDTIFRRHRDVDANLAQVVVPPPEAPEPADPDFWCILKESKGTSLEQMAYDIVRNGEAKAVSGVPVGQFGCLKSVDRGVIESYRSIRNLIHEYLDAAKAKRPLSIAVFGPPGSGKSFGVTQVAESVAPGQLKPLEFNMSQLQSPDDLAKAFHRVRDIVLGGKVPMVFFDEFDSALAGKLGWLKYFLAPMQDGAFRDGETIHPIGRAIFIFAGGTSESYESFCCGRDDASDPGTYEATFRGAKGPDFVSRLRGYVNIVGVNPENDDDRVFMVRRAIILRSMIERFAKHLIEKKTEKARIDDGVLRAMIKVWEYKHGARSMEAILDMSMLAGRRRFEQSSLPSFEQLKLHVDADQFLRLVVRDVLFGSARELLAEAVQKQYRIDQKENKEPDDPAMAPWADLGADYKESCRQQADDIPGKLKLVGYGYMPVVGRKPKLTKFTAKEIEVLAEKEHGRYVLERTLAGWTYASERSDKKKTNPSLVPWDDLSDDVKKWDRDTIINIPKIMALAGFEIYKLKRSK
jgi:RyR domain-containing protein/ATPase family protein associated with various cellular activities (AAA)